MKKEYGEAIGNVIAARVSKLGGGSPLTGVRAQALLRDAENMRDELAPGPPGQ